MATMPGMPKLGLGGPAPRPPAPPKMPGLRPPATTGALAPASLVGTTLAPGPYEGSVRSNAQRLGGSPNQALLNRGRNGGGWNYQQMQGRLAVLPWLRLLGGR